MEQLYNLLTDDRNREQAAQFISVQNESLEFGSLLFQILHNEIPSNAQPNYFTFLKKICFLLKNWGKLNWGRMPPEQKIQCFDSLKNLILSIKCDYVIILSDFFIDISKMEKNTQIYEVHYNDFFAALSTPGAFSMDQLIALLNIIKNASKKYKKSSKNFTNEEVTAFISRVYSIILPYLGNEALLQTHEGCNILSLIFPTFKNLFFRVSNNPNMDLAEITESASIPLNFSNMIEIEFIRGNFLNTKLIDTVVDFLGSFYRKYRNFEETATNIIQICFQMISVAVELPSDANGNDPKNFFNLILNISKIINFYNKYVPPEPNFINALLVLAKLTQSDIEYFNSFPEMFYYNIYDRQQFSKNENSSRLSRSTLAHLITNNEPEIKYNVIHYMLTLPPTENVIRCLSFCIHKCRSEKFTLPQEIIPLFGQMIENPSFHEDLILFCSVLDFLYNFLPFIPFEQKISLMGVLPNFLEKSRGHPLPSLFCVKLLTGLMKYDVSPFDNAVHAVIQTLPTSFTSDAFICLKKMVEIQREAVLPYSDFILDGIFEKLNYSINVLCSNNDEDDDNLKRIEFETENISYNLDFCVKLIKGAGPYLVKPYFVEIVSKIFELASESEELIDVEEKLVDLLIAIFGTGTQLVPNFFEIIMKSCHTEEWKGHSGHLMFPLFELISSHRQYFIELGLCGVLSNFCMEMLTDESQHDNENCFDFGCLLSWAMIVDSQSGHQIGALEIQNIFQYGSNVCTSGTSNVEIVSSFLEVLGTISVCYNNFPNEAIIGLIQNAAKSDWFLRLSQKYLFVVFFFTLARTNNALADSAAFLAFKLLNDIQLQSTKKKENNDDEYDYDAFGGEEDDDFDLDPQYPVELSYLTIPFPFTSPIQSFPLVQLAVSVVQICSKDAIESIQQEFPVPFGQMVAQHQQMQTQQQQPNE